MCVTVALVGLAQAAQPSEKRFVVLPPDQFGHVWVLDTTTALRWQMTPDNTLTYWETAGQNCTNLRDGARLPKINELISLVDYSVAGNATTPVLPADNPFGHNVQSADYWSATMFAADHAFVWRVGFLSGGSGRDRISSTDPKIPIDQNYVWCVR